MRQPDDYTETEASFIEMNNKIDGLTEHLQLKEEECKQLQKDKTELVEALDELFCSIDDGLTCCMNERKLQIIGHLLEKHKCDSQS